MPTEAFEGSIHETQERISTDYVDLFGIHEIWLGAFEGKYFE
jgi:aryl-alcohol dehydrogenase-like predicted oxidoreductase